MRFWAMLESNQFSALSMFHAGKPVMCWFKQHVAMSAQLRNIGVQVVIEIDIVDFSSRTADDATCPASQARFMACGMA